MSKTKKGKKRKAPPTRILVMILIISLIMVAAMVYFAYLIHKTLAGTNFCLAIIIVFVIGTGGIIGFIKGSMEYYSK